MVFEWLSETKNSAELSKNFNLIFGYYGITEEVFQKYVQGKRFSCSAIDYAVIKYYDEVVGIIGYYVNKNFPSDAWLGWFGILPHCRGKHYAEKALEKWERFISEKFKEIKYLRIYTSEKTLAPAVNLYKKLGYIPEQKRFEDVDGSKQVLVMSKPINKDISLQNWDKQPIW